LRFPRGSQRTSVDKIGTFEFNDRNAANTFKASGADDKETIRQR
jgi:hypothetical protein